VPRGSRREPPSGRPTRDDSSGTAPVMPPSGLVKAGRLTYCSDMRYPPEISIQFGEPVGYDHDIGVAVANEMGLRAEFVQTPFALDLRRAD